MAMSLPDRDAPASAPAPAPAPAGLTPSAVARLIVHDGARALVPITCRFVPYDQWLVSHVDSSWKVKDVKHWLLRKCHAWGTSPPEAPRFRPASPVTFAASRRSSVDSAFSHGDTDAEGDEDDWDLFPFDYNKEIRAIDTTDALPLDKSANPTNSGRSTSVDEVGGRASPALNADNVTMRFALFSYSNGHILEDDASLSWYHLRPYELLELHRLGAIVRLPRNSLSYIEPYFDSPVRMLDGSALDRDAARRRKARQPKKTEERKAEWRDRWIVIREGLLSIGKDALSVPIQKFALCTLCALRGPDYLGATSKAHPRAICIKFDAPDVSSPETDEPISQYQRQQDNDPDDDSGIWIVMEMPSDSSHENLLRVLHRIAPHPTPSTFLPSASSPKTPSPSPADSLVVQTVARGILKLGVQFPEWRMLALRRARRAGLGEVGPAMAHFLYGAGEEGTPGGTSPAHGIRRKESSLSAFAQARVESEAEADADAEAGMRALVYDTWTEDDEDDGDVESEVEWEGWVHDIGRHTDRQWMSPGPLSAMSQLSPSSSPSSPSSFDNWGTDTAGRRVRTVSFEPQQRTVIVSTKITAGAKAARSRSSTISATPALSAPGPSGASSSSSTTSPKSAGKAPASVSPQGAAGHNKRRSLNLKLKLSQSDLHTPKALAAAEKEGRASGGPRSPLLEPRTPSSPAEGSDGTRRITSMGLLTTTPTRFNVK